jgi:hypothetical protein
MRQEVIHRQRGLEDHPPRLCYTAKTPVIGLMISGLLLGYYTIQWTSLDLRFLWIEDGALVL